MSRRTYVHVSWVAVGGGAAGSVLANRLSQNPENQVLLLEKGGDPNPFTQVPALASTNIISGSQTISHRFRTITQANACGVYQAVRKYSRKLNPTEIFDILDLIFHRNAISRPDLALVAQQI